MAGLTVRRKFHEFVAGKKGHTLIAMSVTRVVGNSPRSCTNACNPASQNLAPIATARSSHCDLYLGYVHCWV